MGPLRLSVAFAALLCAAASRGGDTQALRAIGQGKAVYLTHCAPCHGARGEGTDKARSLSPPARAPSAAEVEKVIREGIAGTTM